MMTNAEIFRKAADYIREHGWMKGAAGWHWDVGARPVCIEGSLLAACGIPGASRSYSREFGQLKELVAERVGVKPYFVWAWNDLHGNKDAVIALLDGLAFDEDLRAAAQSSPLPADTTIPVAVQIPQLVEMGS